MNRWLRLVSFLIRSISLAARLRVSCFTLIVGFDSLAEAIGASFVKDLCNDRDRLVAPLPYQSFIIHGRLGVIESDNPELAQWPVALGRLFAVRTALIVEALPVQP